MAEKSVTESRRLPVSKENIINLTMAEKSVTESRRLPVSKEKTINLTMAEESVTESRRLPVSKEKTINLTMAEKSVTESRRLHVSKEKIINLNLTEMKEENVGHVQEVIDCVNKSGAGILTIQTALSEAALASLLLDKLPGFKTKFSPSLDTDHQANTCIAWNMDRFRATVVEVRHLTSLFPLLSNYNMTMVHLWAMETNQPTPLSSTVISWSGITMKNKVRSQAVLMDSLMRFLSMYRAHSHMTLRMIIGGYFTVDLKLLQFRKISSFSFLDRRGDNSNTFIFTKEIIRLMEVSNEVKDKGSILNKLVEVVVTESPSRKAVEKPEECIYHKTMVKKTEQKLAFSEACQTRLGAKMQMKVMEKKDKENKAEDQEKEVLEKVRKAMKKHVSEKSKVGMEDCKTLNTNHRNEKKKLIDEGVESFENTSCQQDFSISHGE